MFNIQGSEVIIVLLLALVVLGPEKLPDAMRQMGRFYADLKKMSTSFQQEFKAAVDEPVRELRDTANTLRDSADFRKFSEGEREEKPKSAEMPPGDPDAVPTTDLPFGDETRAGDSNADAGTSAEEDAGPKPFSGSQTISAAAPSRAAADDSATQSDEPTLDQIAIDDEHGLREARPTEAGPEGGGT